MPAKLLAGCKKSRKKSFKTNVQFEVKDASNFLKRKINVALNK